MIRWWAAYLAFLYASGAVLNIILDQSGLLRGWWLLLPDIGLGTVIALVVRSPRKEIRR